MRASDIYAKESTKSGMPGEDDSKSREVLRQAEGQTDEKAYADWMLR
jgi:hypothetical protein